MKGIEFRAAVRPQMNEHDWKIDPHLYSGVHGIGRVLRAARHHRRLLRGHLCTLVEEDAGQGTLHK